MNFLPVGNKADHIRLTLKNEDTVSIPPGTPVSLMLNGTDDGLAIALPSTNGAAKAQSAFLGVTLATHAVNDVGTVISFGIVPYALLTVMTRGASSNSWSSSASVAVGELLAIDTINNAFLLESASLGSPFLPDQFRLMRHRQVLLLIPVLLLLLGYVFLLGHYSRKEVKYEG